MVAVVVVEREGVGVKVEADPLTARFRLATAMVAKAALVVVVAAAAALAVLAAAAVAAHSRFFAGEEMAR